MKVDGGLGMGSTSIADIAREAKSQEEREIEYSNWCQRCGHIRKDNTRKQVIWRGLCR